MKTSILGFSALFLAACSSAFGTSEPSEPGAAAPPPAPPPLTGKPADAELTEQYGVFVTTNGTADGDGSRAHPLGTIAAGISLAKQKALRVYVCVGTYSEQLTLASGVSVVGGLICDDPSLWTQANGQRSRIEAPASPAVRASDVGVPTRFDGFDVVAPKGAPSSIALLASNAPALTIANGSLTASDGANGTSGAEPSGAPSSGNGNDGHATVFEAPASGLKLGSKAPQRGGGGGTSACGGGAGGAGADGASWSCGAVMGGGGTFYLFALNTDLAGNDYEYGSPGAGTGAAGAAGTDGASAQAIGTFTVDGYVTADGVQGGNGTPGAGGAGGAPETVWHATCSASVAGWNYFGASGPGGGAGGCAGLAGKPGLGGGASVGALVFASAGITFDGVDVKAGNGGDGGAGSLGSDATAGGAPGVAPANAGAAQPGGSGGRAGVSGSGAGGPSFGIAHTGGAPAMDPSTKVAFGAPGKGVPASSRTDATGTRTLPASADGVAADVHGF